MLPGIIWIALAGPAGGLVRQEMHGECGAWICSVRRVEMDGNSLPGVSCATCCGR